ncbi:hypothetical protein V1292_002393 [Bradyrhizobium sp. AZCC 1719]|uniref:hypothetical protein n=1 Tax=Bradyrhizobium sp. AZCC 1719 TaxID=3117028 RepID=UPI002FF0DBA1
MSGATFFRDEAGTLSPFWRFVLIVAIFLLIWPPIFGNVGWWMKFDFGPSLLVGVTVIATWSYFFAPAALFAGIIHAVAAISFHYNSVWVPLLTAVCATILIMVSISAIGPGPTHSLIDVPLEGYVIFIVASLIASLICWRLTRRFARLA